VNRLIPIRCVRSVALSVWALCLSLPSFGVDFPYGDPLIFAAESFGDGQLRQMVTDLTPASVGDPLPYPVAANLPSGDWNSRTSGSWWHAGFFPGLLWNYYEVSGESFFETHGRAWSNVVLPLQNSSTNHDMGFMFMPSFGRGYDLTGDPSYPAVLINAANGLSAHWIESAEVLWSFNFNSSRDGRSFRRRENIIIDSMMNMELMYWAAKNGGDASLYERALKHQKTAIRDLIREDGSTYQLATYDVVTGAFKHHVRWQGFSVESTWARGQGWALHGLSSGARETGDPALLAAAQKVAEYYLSDVPADGVAYWDFEALRVTQQMLQDRYEDGNASPVVDPDKRDSSAAVLVASGLLELCLLVEDPVDQQRYFNAAEHILLSLASPVYLAQGTVYDSILTQSTSTFQGVDKGLIYTDFYFTEAILRYRNLLRPRTQFSADPLSGSFASYWPRNRRLWHVNWESGDLRLQLYGSGVKALPNGAPGEIAVLRNRSHTDFSMSLDLKLDENLEIRPEADVVLVFAHTSAQDYAYVLLSAKAGESGLYHLSNGTLQQLSSLPDAVISAQGWHRASLSRIAEMLQLDFNGENLFALDLSTFNLPASGRLGIGSRDDAAFFDDIVISGTSSVLADSGWLAFQQQFASTHPMSLRAMAAWDFEGDGGMNGFEYIRDTDPAVDDLQQSSLQLFMDQGQPTVEFHVPMALTDVQAALWSSPDLLQWDPVQAHAHSVVNGEQIYRYAVPTAPRSFFHIRFKFLKP